MQTFIEVPFVLDGQKVIPDGVIKVVRGSKTWTALVEVKTGTNELRAEQLEAYLEVAREQDFDALITISNEIPPGHGQHPAKLDKRKLKKVALHHIPWTKVLYEAVLQKEHRGVADPDQAWVLGELIRYLEYPKSGAMAFDDMGSSWVTVRDSVRAGTLRGGDAPASEVALRFDALMSFAALQLGRKLGTEVITVLSRKEIAEPQLRLQAQVTQLSETGTLSAAIRIPDTVGLLTVTADLRANQVICHIDVDAPREGRGSTRVNWLVRQLKNAPQTARIDAFQLHGRGAGASELLGRVREDPKVLLGDSSKELKSFRVALMAPMGVKRGVGKGAFIDSVLSALGSFYEDVVQHLKAWTPAPPKVRSEIPTESAAVIDPGLVSSALSSQDGAERVDDAPVETEKREPSLVVLPEAEQYEPTASSSVG
ncbi:hypothetical protein DMH04_35875 [Kibdelosporangium aridum]|uniref:Stress response protein n=1 Tax=Kibdelosporangium aridum TaxID=2030 RepID=A0A428YZX7_KIBAR|nr:hypothetical protein [Kibdelosporangium aridum]RSM77023.1 hypothetical protein DMH04_35875 [Kibdelosporangium aridum]